MGEEGPLKYRLDRQIGKGATSAVFSATNTETGEEVCIKRIPSWPPRNLSLALNEINVLQKISHPNVIRMIETVETRDKTYLVMERCKFSLSSIAKSGEVPEKVVVRIARDVLVGLNHLHSLGIIHRDIKLGNVMISKNNEVKIIDFGLSVDTNYKNPRTLCGTPEFISPEIMNRGPYTKKTDIYSAGVLIYFLLFRRDFSLSYLRERRDKRDFVDLIEKMTERDPDRRIGALDALSHRLFRSFFPNVVDFDKLTDFSVNTKLGRIDLKNKTIFFRSRGTSFFIKMGMNGVYVQPPSSPKNASSRTFGEGVYSPFVSLDSRSLKMVSFCFSFISLMNKKTPLVVIFTDNGKFFKMIEDGVYFYVSQDCVVEWKKGVFALKKNKTPLPTEALADIIQESTFKTLIFESMSLLNNNAGSLPIVVDKRRACGRREEERRGVLYDAADIPSLSTTVKGYDQSTLNIAPSPLLSPRPFFLSAPLSLPFSSPVFLPEKGWCYKPSPFTYQILLCNGSSLSISSKPLICTYKANNTLATYPIDETAPQNVKNILFLFLDFLEKTEAFGTAKENRENKQPQRYKEIYIKPVL